MKSLPESKASHTVDVILSHRQEIYQAWRQAFREQWGDKLSSRETLLEKAIAAGEDLLSVVLQMITSPGQDLDKFIDPLVTKIRRPDLDYEVFDVFLEASSLDNSWDTLMKQANQLEPEDLLDARQVFHQNLCQLLQKVLHLTLDSYRYILEAGSRGFCQIDASGIIIHANANMHRLLGVESAYGRRLEDFFQGSERDFVRRAYSGANGQYPGDRRLRLISAAGQPIMVGAEIAPIYLDGTFHGGYACLVNLSKPIEAETAMLNQTPFGVARVDLDGHFIYANPNALEILGLETWEGKNLSEVFPDPANWQIVAAQLELRRQGKGDVYEATVTRLSDKTNLRVKIYSRPETDLQGKVIGSLAMIRSLEIEKALDEMHKAIETIPSGQKILAAVAAQAYSLFPYDLFSVSVYSANLGHVRRIFAYAPNHQEPPKWEVRWWENPDYVVAWVKEHQEVEAVDDLKLFFQEKGWLDLTKRPHLQELLAAYRSCVRYPVIREDRVVAAVTIFSKKAGNFSPYQELIASLPLDKAVVMALHYEEKDHLNFLLQLIEDISTTGHDIHHAAEVIVQRLGLHYEWSNVALFRVDENQKQITLLCQQPLEEKFRLPPNYRQDIDRGILGYVREHRQSVKIANVKTDPFFKDIFISLVPEARSELCLPIKTSSGYWLLNIEDSAENAFSEEDQQGLERLLRQVAVFLDRALLQCFVDATLFYTSNLVIITDDQAVIKRVNPAVTAILEYEDVDMYDHPLMHFFKDPLVANDLVESGAFPSQEVTLVGKSGRECAILLSASSLPEDLGGRIFIGKDLSLHKRLEELEYLGKMYYEVATQTKTPLSLAFSLLKSLEKQASEPKVAALLDKTLKQLNKVELTLDRLAILERGTAVLPYNEYLLDVNELLREVFNGLPPSEVDKIKLTPAPLPTILLRGDLFQLSFCLTTIFSYLWRFAPEDDQIACRLSSNAANLFLEIAGSFPGSPPPGVSTQTSWDIALGEPIIKQILEKHNGSMVKQITANNLAFTITLPRVSEM